MTGIVPGQGLADALAAGWITSEEYRIPDSSIQPASMDLRLGELAWALRCSFLPDTESTVDGPRSTTSPSRRSSTSATARTLERDRPYLIPLVEELRAARLRSARRRTRRARPAGSTSSPA